MSKVANWRLLLLAQVKFLSSSVVATGVDYGLFFLLYKTGFDPLAAHVISYPIAVVANFYLQKQFIFKLRRSAGAAFAISMVFSAIGWGLGTGLLFLFLKLPLLTDWPVLAKVLVTGLLFFFNFYTKQFAFERRFFSSNPASQLEDPRPCPPGDGSDLP
jgi:putative flippase GtrA